MQSLATFFEDNKPLAYAATVAAILVLIIVVFVLYRLLFGRRLRAATNGRARQPRLGIVDAYDLDRQRQLVLVRRDNVEHLIMIGGPTDVVVESSIVRTQSAAPARDKDGGGPLLGAVTPPASLAAAGQTAALPPASAGLPPVPARTEPILGPRAEPPAPARAEPTPATRSEPPMAARTEPTLGGPIPMPSPIVERPLHERGAGRPLAVPDPSAPSGPPSAGPAPAEPAQQQGRSAPPRPAGGLPPRAASTALSMPGAGPAGGGPSGPAPAPGSPDRPGSPRPPLPPRPPAPRTPLPPRPSLASSLPPRPARPLPTRSEPQRPEGETMPAPLAPPGTGPGQGAESEPRIARGPEPAAPRANAPAPPRTIESLESLEEEMAKLLGRPTPRRDG